MNTLTIEKNKIVTSINMPVKKICIIGLGYVGLPLAVEFGKKYQAVGFDINQARVDELNGGKDSTLESWNGIIKICLKE